jgi:DNA-binding phage protein
MFKKRKENYNCLYVVIQETTNEVYIYKEVTPLSEKIGVDRSTIYRKFKLEGNLWSKNGYKVIKTFNIYLKSRRGK